MDVPGAVAVWSEAVHNSMMMKLEDDHPESSAAMIANANSSHSSQAVTIEGNLPHPHRPRVVTPTSSEYELPQRRRNEVLEDTGDSSESVAAKPPSTYSAPLTQSPANQLLERQSSKRSDFDTGNSGCAGGWRTTDEYLPSSCSSSSECSSDEYCEDTTSCEADSFYCDGDTTNEADDGDEDEDDDEGEYVDLYTGNERSQPIILSEEEVRRMLLKSGFAVPSAIRVGGPTHSPATSGVTLPTPSLAPTSSRTTSAPAAKEIEICPSDLQRSVVASQMANTVISSSQPQLPAPASVPLAGSRDQLAAVVSYDSEVDEYDSDSEDESSIDCDDDDDDSSSDSSSGSEMDYDLSPDNEFGYLTRKKQIIQLSSATPSPGAAPATHAPRAPLEFKVPAPSPATAPQVGGSSRIPAELQAIFLASQQGATVDQPPSSGVASRVFGSWFGRKKSERNVSNFKKSTAVSQKIVRFFRIPQRTPKKEPQVKDEGSSLAGASKTSVPVSASSPSGRRPSNSSGLRSFSVRSLASRRSNGSAPRSSKGSSVHQCDESTSRGSRLSKSSCLSKGSTRFSKGSRRSKGSRQSTGSLQSIGQDPSDEPMALPSLHTFCEEDLASSDDEDSSHSWDSDISDLSSDDEELYADIEQVLANAKQTCGFNFQTQPLSGTLPQAPKQVAVPQNQDQTPMVEPPHKSISQKSLSFTPTVPSFEFKATRASEGNSMARTSPIAVSGNSTDRRSDRSRPILTKSQAREPQVTTATRVQASFEPTIPTFGKLSKQLPPRLPPAKNSQLQCPSLEVEKPLNKASPRIPLELQEIFLQSNRGDDIEQIQPPSNGTAFQVFQRMWPRKMTSSRNLFSQMRNQDRHLSSRMLASFLTAKLNPKTEEVEREGGELYKNDSSPVTSLDDSHSVESSDESSCSSESSSSSSSYSSYESSQRFGKVSSHLETSQQKEINFIPRIPMDLQAVFLASNRGLEVNEPPSSGSAFKEFDSSRKFRGNRIFNVRGYRLRRHPEGSGKNFLLNGLVTN